MRCDLSASLATCPGGSLSPLAVRRVDRSFHSLPFAVNVNQGSLVTPGGIISLPCGLFGLFAACEAANLGIAAANGFSSEVEGCRQSHFWSRSLTPPTKEYECRYPLFDRVFVFTQYNSVYFGTFILESLPRLVLHLDYVLANHNMAIHFGWSRNSNMHTMTNAYLHWLGLSDRLVNGTVYADEAYLPREGGCQDAGFNAWEIVNQRETLLMLATHTEFDNKPLYNVIINRFIGKEFEAVRGRPFVLIAEAPTSSSSSSNRQSDRLRDRTRTKLATEADVTRWNELIMQVSREFSQKINQKSSTFSKYELRTFSEQNSSLRSCPPCQIRLFARTQVLIGMHGHVLANAMYMKKGGIVVEIIPTAIFDHRMAPVTGIYSRLSSVIGLHHYTYAIDNLDIHDSNKHMKIVEDIITFHDKVTLWNSV